MDVLSRSNSLSYAAAFGLLSNVCYDVIVNQEFAIDYEGPIYLKG